MSSARKAFAPRESTSTAWNASRALVDEIKQSREATGLTPALAYRRCGIDQPALSRLEIEHKKNPTLDTLSRYAAAVGRRLVLPTWRIDWRFGPGVLPRCDSISADMRCRFVRRSVIARPSEDRHHIANLGGADATKAYRWPVLHSLDGAVDP